MQPTFWHTRWHENQIGFHLSHENPHLVRHHAAQLAGSPRILVPLCGKSHDLAFLAAHDHDVVGVELSPVAVRAFFDEHGLAPSIDRVGPFERHRAGRITLLCGDFFALTPEHTGPLDAWFDRAALVALPSEMRADYVSTLVRVLPSGARGLLVSFDYEPSSAGGPPFSIAAPEVHARLDPWCDVQPLARVDILDAEPRFRERGITQLHEDVYALTRR